MPKILFLSEDCLLDRRSGAAHSARAILRALAAAGWQARAATLSLCDGETPVPLEQLHPALDGARHEGERATVEDGLLTHEVVLTHSTRHTALRPWELRDFHAMARELLAQWQPDVVLSYCSELSYPLLAQARRQGARTVFYLAHASHALNAAASLPDVDEWLVPSQAMADLYQDKRSLQTLPLDDLVTRLFDGRRNLAPERLAARRERYVTMVNPQPDKGGLFFINLAAQAAAVAPGVRFRAVESRWGRSDWAARGIPAADLDRIDWQPATDDMARLYSEAALLLVPSLGFEASGRVVAEALLAGVPVLAMRTGGIAVQLGDGGFLFELPQGLACNPLAAPELADLKPWVEYIRVLMSHDALYERAVRLALDAAGKHDPVLRAAHAVSVFEALLEKPMLPGLAKGAQIELAAQRERMNAHRLLANARVQASEPAHGETLQDSPYFALLKRSLAQPAIQDALAALNARNWIHARGILEDYLRLLPEDIAALGMLAEVAEGEKHDAQARELLQRVVALAPGFVQGQQRLLALLQRTGDVQAALALSFALMERAPLPQRDLALHARLLDEAGRFEDAIEAYEAYFRHQTGNAHDWARYGLALEALRRPEEAVSAYRMAIALAPELGAAWQALANVLSVPFAAEEIHQMQTQLQRTDLSDDDRAALHFALGKAQEIAEAWEPSFEHYAAANRIRRSQSDYDVGRIEDYVAQAKEVFTAGFFAARSGYGNPARDPVFLLGVDRDASTLVAQILVSHSAIEDLREPPHLLRLCADLGGSSERHGSQAKQINAALLADLGGAELARLGRHYLDLCAPGRRTSRPMFVDRMFGHWMRVGQIHLMLPNARLVDIRRAPMAAGFSLFRMNFGHGQDQRDIARYYRAYVDLMAHFDAVLPGRIRHIRYEDLVGNSEAEIRRLVEYCGLPLEHSCLRHGLAECAIQTPLAEQWRHYTPWLKPMRDALGDLVAAEPGGVPAEAVNG